MKKLSFIILVSFICLGLSSSYAQNDEHKKRKNHGNPALKKEVKQYMKQNILPVLREQRTKLEKDISAQDKTQINTYRAELKQNHQLLKEGRKKRKEAKKSGLELSQAEKEAIWIAEGEQKEIIHKTKELGKTYKEEIKVLFEEIADKRDMWKNDLKAIHEKYKPEGDNEKEEEDKEEGHHKGKKGHRGTKMMKMLRPVHFLLLDPNASDDDLEEVFDDNGTGSIIYPNPSKIQNNIRFEVKKAGDVEINLFDNNGNIVKNLLKSHKEIGVYTISADVSDLNSNTGYFYKINTPTSNETKRFVLNN